MKNNQAKTRQPTQTQLFKGYVSQVDEVTGRVRVRIDDLDGMESYWLDVLQERVKDDQHAYWLDVDDFVAVLADERLEWGVVLGCLYSEQNPPPIATKDRYYKRFSDGSFLDFDRTTGILEISCTKIVITGTEESTINDKAIAVIGAMDNDSETNGPDALVTSGQL